MVFCESPDNNSFKAKECQIQFVSSELVSLWASTRKHEDASHKTAGIRTYQPLEPDISDSFLNMFGLCLDRSHYLDYVEPYAFYVKFRRLYENTWPHGLRAHVAMYFHIKRIENT